MLAKVVAAFGGHAQCPLCAGYSAQRALHASERLGGCCGWRWCLAPLVRGCAPVTGFRLAASPRN